MAAIPVCLLVTLLIRSSLCMQVHAARWRAPFRRVAHNSNSRRRQETQGAPLLVERNPTHATVGTRLFFAQLHNVVREIRVHIPPWEPHRGSYRRDVAYAHEVSTRGREAVAALIHPSRHENAVEDGAQCVLAPGERAVFSSVYHNGTLEYLRLDMRGRFLLRNEFGEFQTACVIHQPTAIEVPEDGRSAAKRALRHEFQQYAGYNLEDLAALEELYRIATPRDILFPADSAVSREDAESIYVNALLLYGPTELYLSFMLPLARGQIPRCAGAARQLELAKISLSCQAISILARIAAAGVLPPRFSDGSFTVSHTGVLYLTLRPNPRRAGMFADTSVFGTAMPCNVAIEQAFVSQSTSRSNEIDLAALLHNIWCPISAELVNFEVDPEALVPRLTDRTQCYSLLPAAVRGMIAALVNGVEKLTSIRRSRMYRALAARLENDAAAP